MTLEQAKVEYFHRTFGLTVGLAPQIPTDEDANLRVSLIQEELNELKLAFKEKNLIKIADAIADLLYVVYGSAVTCGIDIEPVFDEIHSSNMSKHGGHRRADGKWIKPPTYRPPNIQPILDNQHKAKPCLSRLDLAEIVLRWMCERGLDRSSLSVLPNGRVMLTINKDQIHLLTPEIQQQIESQMNSSEWTTSEDGHRCICIGR